MIYNIPTYFSDLFSLLRKGRYFGVALFLLSTCSVQGQSMEDVPGVVISHIPAPNRSFGFPINPVYVSDPCILVLSNGEYLAAHAQFGSASGSGTQGRTRVFRSSDQGETWTKVNQGNDLIGILRGSLFERNGAVYLLGANKDTSPNDGVMFRSLDNGDSWESVAPFGGSMATPDNALEFGGRLWLASSRSSVHMAMGDDPLDPDSWSRSGGFPSPSNDWLPGTGFNASDNFIGEGQMTASSLNGLAILPKVRLMPYIAVISVHPQNGRVVFDPDHDFVRLEGGEKKFGVRYDEVSGKYYMLANPILPAHYGSSLAIDLIRNTAAVLSSPDLRNWRTEQIFLYSPNISYEGFQYFNFDIDGDDLVVASRTAFDVGGNKPPRGHDSNLLTFHRIENFRNLAREQVLRIEGGQVRRYEKTQHADAPLGRFALGNTFGGAPLSNPVALGTANGAVYVQEHAGRILRFDLLGNFLGTVISPPVVLQSSELELPQPATRETTWTSGSSGLWDNPRNWHDWTRPGTAMDTAVFGSAATAPVAVSISSTARLWSFEEVGNFEGWLTQNVSNETVSNGVLRGTAQNHAPNVHRTSLNFKGSEAPEVRVRLRSDTVGNSPASLFWGTWTSNNFSTSRRIQVNYTGDGEFQELVFPMAGKANWDGERITRIRIDPLSGEQYAGVQFEIDSVSIPLDSDGLQIQGLRFQNSHAYTLDGSGSIRIGTDNGPARIDVMLGDHQINIPLVLATDTDIWFTEKSSLVFTRAPILSGNTIHLRGDGTAKATDWTLASDDTLQLSQSVLGTVNGTLHMENGAHIKIEDANLTADKLTLSPGGEAILTLPVAPQPSPLQVDGDLSLGSGNTLAFSISSQFEADRNDTFPLITHTGERTGYFQDMEEGAVVEANGHLFTIHYNLEPGIIGLQYLGISFQKWVGEYELPENQAGPDKNPTGDGVPNLIKYVRGFSPLVPVVDPRNVFHKRTQTINGEPHLILEMARDPKAPEHQIKILLSEDLIHWEESPGTIIIFADTPETFQAGINLTAYAKAFLRLRIDRTN